MVGYLTFENQSTTAWQHIFEICAVMNIVPGIIYIIFNDTSVQPWNNRTIEKDPKLMEEVPLKQTEKDEKYENFIEKKDFKNEASA